MVKGVVLSSYRLAEGGGDVPFHFNIFDTWVVEVSVNCIATISPPIRWLLLPNVQSIHDVILDNHYPNVSNRNGFPFLVASVHYFVPALVQYGWTYRRPPMWYNSESKRRTEGGVEGKGIPWERESAYQENWIFVQCNVHRWNNHATNWPTDLPCTFTSATSWYDDIQEKINDLVNDYCRLHLAYSIPETNLTNYPGVHDRMTMMLGMESSLRSVKGEREMCWSTLFVLNAQGCCGNECFWYDPRFWKPWRRTPTVNLFCYLCRYVFYVKYSRLHT